MPGGMPHPRGPSGGGVSGSASVVGVVRGVGLVQVDDLARLAGRRDLVRP